MDAVMQDLRDVFADIEIKVSDPVVCFTETGEKNPMCPNVPD